MYFVAMKWWLLVGAIVCEVVATLSLRAATDHPSWYALVVMGYVASFGFLSAVLRRMAVGVAYGIWGACGITITAVAAAVIFGDALTVLMGFGIVLVIAGVLVVELGAQAAEDERAAGGAERRESAQ
ncbi:multidrug resistance protein EbrB [Rhodococcus sp. Br-6]|uniref:Multidrug resistance protein, SMR family n=3 Tax=Rhodococcus hoagii TaxID=43767 RepID=E9T0Y1_RHOHA|nr:multidrug resistance protein, SMR family [Prescottella equi ATCC 33707]SUE02854.1 small multidrug resistance protein [Prescottella equi]GBF14496.1 multidrug resistance protein EbrB [Rhodococcus sp. Br-6]SUE22073.1 small multidrug resistance protein [Prescottella equi]BCN42586.1 cation transporter [Prescottella equi]